MEKKHKVAQHTPGPWETSSNGRDWVVCEGGAGDMICDLADCGNDKHNARLIAAAPELLAALEAWVDCEIASQECFKLSRAAINKAHGND